MTRGQVLRLLRALLPDLLFVAGAVLALRGVALLSVPLAWILAGGILMLPTAAALLRRMRDARPKGPPPA